MSELPTWACEDCSPTRTFNSLEKKRAHDLEYHTGDFIVVVSSDSHPEHEVTVTRVDGVFVCPTCDATFRTKTGCRKHLLKGKCRAKDGGYSPEEILPAIAARDSSNSTAERNNDSPQERLPVISMPESVDIPLPPVPGPQRGPRTHEEAVLFSCNLVNSQEGEKQRTLGIIEALDLQPLALEDQNGAEQNVLAHRLVLEKLLFGPVTLSSTIPLKKRRRDESSTCWNCSPASAAGMEHLLSTSPYAANIASRRYVELNDDICELLNRDWRFSTQLRFACARILSGCVLINKRNGQAIVANTVEVYGRTRMVDAHREPFTVRKGHPVTNSLPPSMNIPYKDVWPTTISAPEGERLVIGTGSFDALITSSLRLDSRIEACVGGITTSFSLPNAEHSKLTKIFLDQESVDSGLKLAMTKETWSLSGRDLMWQLRQTKTKFHDPSTYYLCRASSHFARNHPCQPYTIFTLVSFDQAPSGDGAVVSSIFDNIACEIVRLGSKAMLEKDVVMQFRSRCSNRSNAAKEFDGVLSLYIANISAIPILGNHDLNKYLETMAQLLSTYISRANKSVMTFIDQEFSSLTM
ncbi:hypothetical protein BGZ99_001352 [Dissophora globulifera]|uniref:Uncharacterized protein n=1 Tax=Dissophora globulifera TaxID=979702 RepID=A0A9P6UKG5_9FUNG|nr:hypothetical protein BGZ99_001352 [Dissophora globulifera]